MPADYMAADALTYIRESLHDHLSWIHDELTFHYGLETDTGEDHLPDPLSDALGALYRLADDVTDMAVAVGVYYRLGDGRLMHPRHYSNNRPVYSHREIGPKGDTCTVLRLEHPGAPPQPEMEAETRRAGLTV